MRGPVVGRDVEVTGTAVGKWGGHPPRGGAAMPGRCSLRNTHLGQLGLQIPHSFAIACLLFGSQLRTAAARCPLLLHLCKARLELRLPLLRTDKLRILRLPLGHRLQKTRRTHSRGSYDRWRAVHTDCCWGAKPCGTTNCKSSTAKGARSVHASADTFASFCLYSSSSSSAMASWEGLPTLSRELWAGNRPCDRGSPYGSNRV